MIFLKNKDEIKSIDYACKIVRDTLFFIEDKITLDITPLDLDRMAEEYIISKGLTPLYIGKEYMSPEGKNFREVKASDDIRFDLGVNLINKTTLLQTFKILSEVRCLVGTDGGLMHMCGMTDTPMVIGFTVTNPKLRLPITLIWLP